MIKCELCGRYNNKAELTSGQHKICDDCADSLVKATALIRKAVVGFPEGPEAASIPSIIKALADVPIPKVEPENG